MSRSKGKQSEFESTLHRSNWRRKRREEGDHKETARIPPRGGSASSSCNLESSAETRESCREDVSVASFCHFSPGFYISGGWSCGSRTGEGGDRPRGAPVISCCRTAHQRRTAPTALEPTAVLFEDLLNRFAPALRVVIRCTEPHLSGSSRSLRIGRWVMNQW